MDNISSVRLVGFPMAPFIRLVRKGAQIEFTGQGPEMLKYALRVSNISYTFIESPEASHGIELSPGNPTGAMKVLYENVIPFINGDTKKHFWEADMSVIPYSVSLLRMKYMDLSTPYYYATYSTLSGSPKGFIMDSSTLIDIFHYQVWIALVIAMLIISRIFLILSLFDKHKRNSWLFYVLVFFGSLVGQEFPIRIYVGNKARTVIFVFWLIASCCLSSAFMAILLSFLTIPDKPDRIDSAEDIVKYPNVKPIVLRDSIDTFSIKRSKNPKLVKLWKQIERHKGELFFTEMFKPDNLEKTSRGFSVILSDVSILRRSLSQACVPGSQFYIAQNAHYHTAIAYGLRKGLPYTFKHSLTKKLSLFATTHQLQHSVLKATIGAEKCLDAAETREDDKIVHVVQLSLENLKHAFWCFICGLLISFLIFIYELLIFLLIHYYKF